MALNMLAIEGRMVRLINPYFVRPFVRGSKNDATGAQAIFEAAVRPTMHFVPVRANGMLIQAVCRVGEAGRPVESSVA
jgi:transposase